MNLKRTKGDLLIRREKHIGILCNNELGETEIHLENSTRSPMSEPQTNCKYNEKLSKREELLSQLPSSTKVKTILKNQTLTESSHANPIAASEAYNRDTKDVNVEMKYQVSVSLNWFL